MSRRRRAERYPYDLTDDQYVAIWRTYDRVNDLQGWDPGRDHLITTRAGMIDWACAYLDNIDAAGLEQFEGELEHEDEFKIAAWLRELRYAIESQEEERARYAREDHLIERLLKQRKRRRPRN